MTGPRRWPLFLIAAPAAVAVWSGWVGLGTLCGFGVIHPLPGIWDGLRLNTAITLPIGVEAYGAYALGAWLGPDGMKNISMPSARARTFARRSAIGALVLGMAGQVIYHLLAAAHAHRAPWPVVVLVSCLPVVTLGFGAALTHLLRANIQADLPESVADLRQIPPADLREVPPVPAVPGLYLNGSGLLPAEAQPFADELALGEVPAIRRIRAVLHCGQPKAQEVQARLSVLARTQ